MSNGTVLDEASCARVDGDDEGEAPPLTPFERDHQITSPEVSKGMNLLATPLISPANICITCVGVAGR